MLKLLVICCFSEKNPRYNAPTGIDLKKCNLIFQNYDRCAVVDNGFTARPWELRVYHYRPDDLSPAKPENLRRKEEQS